jgi:hypothetical protein
MHLKLTITIMAKLMTMTGNTEDYAWFGVDYDHFEDYVA